jgi:glycosyltransferase involved in cell wall biosynthesis
MAQELRQRYPRRSGDIEVCLNGVDAAFLAVARSAPSRGRLRVAAVGSLIWRKGYDLLLDALARSERCDSIELAIAGAGPEHAALCRQAEQLGVAHQVRFVGALAPARIPGFLANADVLALPSRSEGRPNVVIEALAAELPVICSDLPGVKGLVFPGVNGWCVAVGDIAGLATALDEACADSAERDRRGAAARRAIVSEGYTWANAGERYEALFRRAIKVTV